MDDSKPYGVINTICHKCKKSTGYMLIPLLKKDSIINPFDESSETEILIKTLQDNRVEELCVDCGKKLMDIHGLA